MAKILFIDFNASYYTPTRKHMYELLKRKNHVFAFGPGYQDEYTLQKGLPAYCKKHGPFDIAICSEPVLMFYYGVAKAGTVDALMNAIKSRYVCEFPQKQIELMKKICIDYFELQEPKAIFMIESDPYCIAQDYLELIQELDCLMISVLGKQFLKSKKDIENKEIFTNNVNDLWLEFVSDSSHRVLQLPHFVHESEFCWSPINDRKYEWIVPGIGYADRKQVKKCLIENKVNLVETVMVQKIFGALNKLGIKVYSDKVLQVFFNTTFTKKISETKYGFTCGSALGYPIRKYFEIPALGTVLTAAACNGFEALGFQHEVNCIKCDDPKQIMEWDKYLKEDRERTQMIANAGRELVWEKHRIEKRSIQLNQALSAYICNRFNGSLWEDGELMIL